MSHSIRQPSFASRGFKLALLWILFALVSLATYALSHRIGSDALNAAAAFLAGGHNAEIALYADRAEPSSIEVRQGEQVVFVVKDDSRHDMAEDRSQRREARLASGEIRKGESYALVFRQSGSLSFYDRLNQDIRVTVTVR
ncbi:MAG TPA: hypothetical protein VHE10_03680 [Candidatus Paceibacterota bacterium]|nr:hypothetical protein [Candidatus Paceibacterota bacterium]